MFQIINFIKQRKEQLSDNSSQGKKDERERVKQEDSLLQLLEQAKRKGKMFRIYRVNFYTQCLQLMNKPVPLIINYKQLYDSIARLFMEFFRENEFEDKAKKIQLIQDNEMHKNQSFLLLLLKWMLDYYRSQLKVTKDDFRIPSLTKPIKYNRRLRVQSQHREENTQPIIRKSSLHKRISYQVCIQTAIPDLDWENSKDVGFKQLYTRNAHIYRNLIKNN
ncbi:hypothetical protein pb186bvf_010351 [Paramecium bursaria]